MALKAKTKLACEIARIDPTKMNDAIKANKFFCAPKTSAGFARTFEIEDIITLRIYAFLAETLRVGQEMAGNIACVVKEKIQKDTGDVTICWGSNGFRVEVDHYLAHDKLVKPLQDRPFTMIFSISDLRKEVTGRLEYERDNLALGED